MIITVDDREIVFTPFEMEAIDKKIERKLYLVHRYIEIEKMIAKEEGVWGLIMAESHGLEVLVKAAAKYLYDSTSPDRSHVHVATLILKSTGTADEMDLVKALNLDPIDNVFINKIQHCLDPISAYLRGFNTDAQRLEWIIQLLVNFHCDKDQRLV